MTGETKGLWGGLSAAEWSAKYDELAAEAGRAAGVISSLIAEKRELVGRIAQMAERISLGGAPGHASDPRTPVVAWMAEVPPEAGDSWLTFDEGRVAPEFRVPLVRADDFEARVEAELGQRTSEALKLAVAVSRAFAELVGPGDSYANRVRLLAACADVARWAREHGK